MQFPLWDRGIFNSVRYFLLFHPVSVWVGVLSANCGVLTYISIHLEYVRNAIVRTAPPLAPTELETGYKTLPRIWKPPTWSTYGIEDRKPPLPQSRLPCSLYSAFEGQVCIDRAAWLFHTSQLLWIVFKQRKSNVLQLFTSPTVNYFLRKYGVQYSMQT